MSNNIPIQENISLAPYTTLKIGGPAKYFFVAKSDDDLINAADWARENKLNYCLLGSGSNVLVSDDGFDGLVIKNENVDFEVENNKIYTGSGVNLGYLVQQCIDNRLSGAEFLVGIPGTVGGAIRGNAGAWGRGMGELITRVKIYDGDKIRELSQHACYFTYRGSIFKKKNYLILSAILILQRAEQDEVKEKTDKYWRDRLAGDVKSPSAGCTFQNINLKDVNEERVIKALDISSEEFREKTKHGKLPVGFIIENLGLKGKKIGGAQISEAHCNFIVNSGGATASDIVELISLVKQQIRDKIGVELNEEVQYLGFK